MKIFLKLFSLSLAVVALIACVSTAVEPPSLPVATITSGDMGFIPANATRYAWHPRSGNSYLDSSYDAQSIDDYISQAIRAKLVNKGYQEVSLVENPDFLIGYGIAVESQLSDNQLFAKTLLNTGIVIDISNQPKGSEIEKGTVLLGLYSAGPEMQSHWVAMTQGAVSPQFIDNGIAQDRIESMLRYLDKLPAAAF
jgi:hypothetical protein